MNKERRNDQSFLKNFPEAMFFSCAYLRATFHTTLKKDGTHLEDLSKVGPIPVVIRNDRTQSLQIYGLAGGVLVGSDLLSFSLTHLLSFFPTMPSFLHSAIASFLAGEIVCLVGVLGAVVWLAAKLGTASKESPTTARVVSVRFIEIPPIDDNPYKGAR
jgi:hypothetical protein